MSARPPLGNITNKPTSRMSLAPPKRLSMAPRKTSLGRQSSVGARQSSFGVRLSAAGSGVLKRYLRGASFSYRRQSSIYGRGTTTKEDPRPVMDKQYITQSIKSLISFLISHNFNHSISQKMLRSPSAKDFYNILQFIVHL